MERRLTWDGCVNARDLGGHPLPDGRRTAFGAVVRAENVGRLTDGGWEALVGYGVRTIVDLRFDSECAQDPPREVPVDVVRVPLIDEHHHEALAAIERGDTTAAGYLEMIAWFRPNFVRAIRAIADAPGGCVLVHCNAGKDRTGLVVGLLLTLAGVPPEEIAADYGLSAPNVASWTAEWIAEAPDETERERRRRISACKPEAMLEVLSELERRYGGVRRYLLEGGATEDELDRAVARLVDRA